MAAAYDELHKNLHSYIRARKGSVQSQTSSFYFLRKSQSRRYLAKSHDAVFYQASYLFTQGHDYVEYISRVKGPKTQRHVASLQYDIGNFDSDDNSLKSAEVHFNKH